MNASTGKLTTVLLDVFSAEKVSNKFNKLCNEI
jgi:hypothetical protein